MNLMIVDVWQFKMMWGFGCWWSCRNVRALIRLILIGEWMSDVLSSNLFGSFLLSESDFLWFLKRQLMMKESMLTKVLLIQLQSLNLLLRQHLMLRWDFQPAAEPQLVFGVSAGFSCMIACYNAGLCLTRWCCGWLCLPLITAFRVWIPLSVSQCYPDNVFRNCVGLTHCM